MVNPFKGQTIFEAIRQLMNRLHEKGYIGNPKSKAKPAPLTEEGARLSDTKKTAHPVNRL